MADQNYSSSGQTAPQAPVPPPTQPAPPTPPVPPSSPRYHRRGGIGFGIVLIAIGVIFLIGQFVPGVAWWQLWPLIILLIGFIQLITPDPRDGWGISRVMDGIGTLILGFVLLGNTTGVISWGVWLVLLSLWPVLIIAIGIGIIGRAIGQSWIRTLAPVAIWLAFAYAVAVSFTGVGGFTPIAPINTGAEAKFADSAPLEGATTASLDFTGGAGDIKMHSIGGQLVTVRGSSPFGNPQFGVTNSGTHSAVNVGLDSAGNHFFGPFAAGSIDVGLSDSVLWDATLSTGATSVDADFTHVKLRDLTVKTGASSLQLDLGDVPTDVAKATVTIKAGVSSVDVTVPKEAAVRVVTNSGLSSTDVLGNFERKGPGTWQTPGFGSAANVYEINIESGVGSVSVKQN